MQRLRSILRPYLSWPLFLLAMVRVHRSITHVSGPKSPTVGSDDVLVLGLFRDEVNLLQSFVDHHLGLGCAHVVLLANEAEPAMLKCVEKHPQVTILRSDLPYRRFKHYFKFYLAHRFARTNWCVFADIDEQFDYPYSSQIAIGVLTQYLDQAGFNAVETLMLERFSDPTVPLLTPISDGKTIAEHYRYCSLDSIVRDRTVFSHGRLDYYGGVRAELFGIRPLLTKYGLFRVRDGLWPFLITRKDPRQMSSHAVVGERLADISTVFYHYKFTQSFTATVQRAVSEVSYWNNSAEYQAYQSVLSNNPLLTVSLPHAAVIEDADQLAAKDLLRISERYRQWVMEYSARTQVFRKLGEP